MAETTDPNTAAPPDEAPKSYGSLSLLALGGLAVAVVYALVVLVGAAVALFNRMPWILPTWSLAVPVAAVVLCWAARVQIQNSEGALTGARLTVWGLWLSLAVGLLYAAYYSACYLSVTRMATTVADEMFDDIKNDRLDQAFLLGLPPPRPAADAGLRARLELEYDRGRGGGGPFTTFRQSELVRQIEQGGGADQIECLGVKDWGSTAGGYQVQLVYRVSTPFAASEVLVTVIGVEDDSGGRQWYVKTPQMTAPPVLTEEGRRMQRPREHGPPFCRSLAGKGRRLELGRRLFGYPTAAGAPDRGQGTRPEVQGRSSGLPRRRPGPRRVADVLGGRQGPREDYRPREKPLRPRRRFA